MDDDAPGAPVPEPEQLNVVQDRIEERLDQGSPEAAASELAELRPPDQADVTDGIVLD